MQRAVRLFLKFAHSRAYLKADWSILCPVQRVRRMGKVARAIPPECIERMVSHIDGDSMAELLSTVRQFSRYLSAEGADSCPCVHAIAVPEPRSLKLAPTAA